MGRISENPVSARKEKTDRFMNSSQCRELDRIDGEPMEFEWKNFPGFIALQILAEIHNMMTGIRCEPEQFPGRIIFMSVYYDIVWSEKGSEELRSGHSKTVTEYARRLAHGHWSFLGPGSEKKWYGTHTSKPNGKWDRVAEDMMINFSESGHPVFRGSSALERGALRRKGNGEVSIHFCGDDDRAELVLRTIISVNQLSIYGAVADMCDELAWRLSGRSVRTGNLLLRTIQRPW